MGILMGTNKKFDLNGWLSKVILSKAGRSVVLFLLGWISVCMHVTINIILETVPKDVSKRYTKLYLCKISQWIYCKVQYMNIHFAEIHDLYTKIIFKELIFWYDTKQIRKKNKLTNQNYLNDKISMHMMAVPTWK